MDEKFVKVLFRFYSDVLEKITVETMWAETIDVNKGLYKIDNIPFYASIACGDIVFAEYDDTEEMLTYRETIEYSGNSTIQVVMLNKTVETNTIRDIINSLGCSSEKFKEGYFVINVPAHLNYAPVKQKLTALQNDGTIDYAEPALSENHYTHL